MPHCPDYETLPETLPCERIVSFWESSGSSMCPASQSDPMWLNLNTSSKEAAHNPHKKPLGANLTSLYCFPPHLTGIPFRESSSSKITHWEAPASGLSAQELCVPIFRFSLPLWSSASSFHSCPGKLELPKIMWGKLAPCHEPPRAVGKG